MNWTRICYPDGHLDLRSLPLRPALLGQFGKFLPGCDATPLSKLGLSGGFREDLLLEKLALRQQLLALHASCSEADALDPSEHELLALRSCRLNASSSNLPSEIFIPMRDQFPLGHRGSPVVCTLIPSLHIGDCPLPRAATQM